MRLALVAAVMSIALMPQASGAVQDPPVQTGPKVKITFEDGGYVTLVSNGASVREILAEWTRQGGSTFVNSERLVGTPLTLQFTHVPEKEVMASLLRQAAGYVLGPRRAGTIGASNFEVVYILPTSNPSSGGYTPPPAYQPQPQYSTVGSPDDEIPPVGRGAPPPQPAGTAAAPGTPPPSGPQPAPGYQPATYQPATAAGSGVAVPVIAIPPVTTGSPTPTPTPTPTPAGRGGNPGTSGS
jgi:hypothetical protein